MEHIASTLTPESYAEWRASDVGRITEALELSLTEELIGNVDGKRVLDVGCGDGMLPVRLAQRGAEAIGMDVSAAMVRAAKRRAYRDHVDVRLVVGDAAALPLPDESVDVVSAMTVLCFVADASIVFAQASRVLKPGGRFVIGELGRLSTWAMQRRIRAWSGSHLWQQGHFRTANELRRLATGAGLEPRQVRGAVYYPRSNLAARLMAPWDPMLGKITTFGAAFIALSATKPLAAAGQKQVSDT